MRIFEDEKADRFGNYPALRIRGKDANPQKIYEELWERYGGQGYKFAIVFDCSKDEWKEAEQNEGCKNRLLCISSRTAEPAKKSGVRRAE